jgi:pimeloyl-ACP methyl ester carboxylesterase
LRPGRRLLLSLVALRALAPSFTPRFRPPQEHPWRVEGRTVFVGDREFLVREVGPETGAPLLLIHGLAGSSLSEWYRVGPVLSQHRRLVMLDHRSHGLAPWDRGRFEIDDLADDIAGVLDRLGLAGVSVVGYSMGGAIAQTLAHRHPGKVGKLVLVATFASHPQPYRTLRAIGALVARGWERLTGFGTPDVRAGYLRWSGAVEARHGRWLWDETHRRDPDAGTQALLALLRFDSTRWVGHLENETMVVIPTSDQLVPPAWQYRLAGLLPDCRVVELPGAMHEVPWTHSGALADEISAFLG